MKKFIVVSITLVVIIIGAFYLISPTINQSKREVAKSATLLLSPTTDQSFSMSEDIIQIKWDTKLYPSKHWVFASIKKIDEKNNPSSVGGVIDVKEYYLGQIKWGNGNRLDIRNDDVATGLKEPGTYELTLSVYDSLPYQGPDATPYLKGKRGTKVDEESVRIELTK